MLLWVCALLCTSWVRAQDDEILRNPDFEEPFSGDWVGTGCTLERTNEDAYTGSWSGKVTNRQANWAGVSQFVNIAQNEDYYFTAYIKLINYSGGTMGHSMNSMAEINYSDGTTDYRPMGTSPYMRQSRGWVKVGGDFGVQNKGVTNVRIYIQFADAEVNYLIDTASLTQIVRNPNWISEANARIDQHRRQNLDIRVVTGGSYNPANVEVEVFMHRHHFAFGSAIVADRISGTSTTDRRYQEVFYDNFQWAVFENAMKWKQMEWNQYDINFERVDRALAELRANDILVRGHCIYWDVDERVPDWMMDMNGAQVRTELQRRADYMLQRYGIDDIVHWDVNNEQLHGHFFETKTDDWTLMDWMFKEANRQAPQATLMLNDFSIFSWTESTVLVGTAVFQAIVNSAKELLSRGAPLHGIGTQSHITGAPSPDVLSKRIDVVSEAGLPIWVTELDINLADRNARADAYETALRLYFSRPEIHGVLLWGFWDQQHWVPDAALWEGPDITPNAAGERWIQLVKREWTTYQVLNPTSADQTFSSRAYQALYSVNVKYNGQVICRRDAAYDVPVGQDASWTINVEAC